MVSNPPKRRRLQGTPNGVSQIKNIPVSVSRQTNSRSPVSPLEGVSALFMLYSLKHIEGSVTQNYSCRGLRPRHS